MTNLEIDFIKKIKNSKSWPEIQKYLVPKALPTFYSVGLDWLLILFAFYLIFNISFYLAPLALVIIGSRQRALSNLTHDAAHYNLKFAKKKQHRDIITNLLCAFPMYESVEAYRESHSMHHKFLGTMKDPDSQTHFSYGYNDFDPVRDSFTKIYRGILSSKDALLDSSGISAIINNKNKRILTYWLILSTALVLVLGKMGLAMLAIWFFTRATVYHSIRLFAEFLDHAGLESTNIFTFTRNILNPGPLKHLFHPHEDNYHLVHHLLPMVPHYHLKDVHDILFRDFPEYKNGVHCSGYFFTDSSAATTLCWGFNQRV